MASKNKVSKAYIAGVGMTRFDSPRRVTKDYHEIGVEAGVKALIDAGITYDSVEQAIGCYVFGDSASAQRVFYCLGLTQIPIFNVNNYCSSGSTGLFMAKQLVEAGVVDCVLVIGFERMFPGSLPRIYKDRANPVGRTIDLSTELTGGWDRDQSWTPQLFAAALKEYLNLNPEATVEDFAKIAATNRKHGANFPYGQLQKEVTVEEVLASPQIKEPLNRLQCSPATTGAAAAVIVSEKFLQQRPYLRDQSIHMAGQAMATDSEALYSGKQLDLLGTAMTRRACKLAFSEANIIPTDIDVIELHDCFTPNQMVMMGAMGLAKEGEEYKLVRQGDLTYGGKYLINPSGGLMSRGHPLGATGIAQCAELTWHLRGWATTRARDNTKIAVAHNMGLGGATIVTVLKAPAGGKESSKAHSGISRLGYNPALSCRDITREMLESVRSKHFSEYAMKATEQPLAKL